MKVWDDSHTNHKDITDMWHLSQCYHIYHGYGYIIIEKVIKDSKTDNII